MKICLYLPLKYTYISSNIKIQRNITTERVMKMDEKTQKLQADLRIAAAFLKAYEEVKAQQADRKKRVTEQAHIALEDRRRRQEEERAYFQNLREKPIIPSEKIKAALLKNCGIDLNTRTEE